MLWQLEQLEHLRLNLAGYHRMRFEQGGPRSIGSVLPRLSNLQSLTLELRERVRNPAHSFTVPVANAFRQMCHLRRLSLCLVSEELDAVEQWLSVLTAIQQMSTLQALTLEMPTADSDSGLECDAIFEALNAFHQLADLTYFELCLGACDFGISGVSKLCEALSDFPCL